MSGHAGYPEGSEAAQIFGRPTGQHTHPATHPAWLTFRDWDCAVCDPVTFNRNRAHEDAVRRLQRRIRRPGCFR